MKWFYPLWYPKNFFAKSCIRIRYCPQPTRSFIRMGEERMKQHRSAIEHRRYFILFYFASPLPPAPKYRASCRYANHLQILPFLSRDLMHAMFLSVCARIFAKYQGLSQFQSAFLPLCTTLPRTLGPLWASVQGVARDMRRWPS